MTEDTETTAEQQQMLKSIPAQRQEELLRRHAAFWKRERGSGPLIGFAPSCRIFPLQNLDFEHEGRLNAQDITDQIIQSDTQFVPPIDPEDELLPGKIPLEPLAFSEGYTGAGVYMSSKACTVWTKPGDDVPQNIQQLEDGLQSAWMEVLIRATSANVKAAQGRYLISEALFRGPADCMEALIGAERLCLWLYDRGELVQEMADWLAEKIITLTKAQLAAIPEFHSGRINRYRIWGPGTNIVTQADISNILSPDQFRESFLPAYRKIAGAFDTATMHFHSSSAQHVDALLEIDELAAIEWGLDPVGPSLEDMVPVFKRILETKCVIIMNIKTEQEVQMLLDKLPHEGLCIIKRKDYK